MRVTSLLLSSALLSTCVHASAAGILNQHGHVKGSIVSTAFPGDSIFTTAVDSPSTSYFGDLRLGFGYHMGATRLVSDYVLAASAGDASRIDSTTPTNINPPMGERHLFDLSHEQTSGSSSYIHRLDRFYIEHSDTKLFIRFGRQALSWGNSLYFAPMDFINPFDPVVVDKEYKTGDDMLYSQWLLSDGDDLQIAWVIRRDTLGDVNADESTLALKYRGFIGPGDFDLLLASHYDDTIIGLGGSFGIGGAIAGGDITLTHATSDVISLTVNLAYSWISMGHNMSGSIEYFHNGFGSASDVREIGELSQRITRGELFTRSEDYLAASVLIELTPLWQLTPALFHNLDDSSSLLQLVSNYDAREDMRLIASLMIPMGERGTEYGGSIVAMPASGTFYDRIDAGLFLQLGWYF